VRVNSLQSLSLGYPREALKRVLPPSKADCRRMW